MPPSDKPIEAACPGRGGNDGRKLPAV